MSKQIEQRPTVVVMAKPAVPGRVKTRLIGDLTPHQAAQTHAAMLGCVLERLPQAMASPGCGSSVDYVLALDGFNDTADGPGSAGTGLGMGLELPAGWRVLPQGQGDLGDRMTQVWQSVGEHSGNEPVLFFGVDSPDVPSEALRSALQAVAGPDSGPAADAAVGPVEDGGYWTLAGRRYRPELLTGIDWGTPAVYDQTLAAGRAAGLTVASLPPWYDVDDAAGLAGLRERLRDGGGPTAVKQEPALAKLSDRLDRICGNNCRA